MNWFQRKIIRPLVSKLANHTPNTVYFPHDWPVKINDMMIRVEHEKGSDGSPLSAACMTMACAAHQHLKSGDELTVDFSSVSFRGAELGDYTVVVKRH